MELIALLSGAVVVIPLVLSILRSLNLLGTQAGSYYDFSPMFKNIKPWTIAVYMVIVIILTFAVLLIAGIPVAKIPA